MVCARYRFLQYACNTYMFCSIKGRGLIESIGVQSQVPSLAGGPGLDPHQWDWILSHLHRQVTLLKLLRDFKHCDNLNRECGRVKNGWRCFDCDEKILNLAHLSMCPAHLNYWPWESSWICPGPFDVQNPPIRSQCCKQIEKKICIENMMSTLSTIHNQEHCPICLHLWKNSPWKMSKHHFNWCRWCCRQWMNLLHNSHERVERAERELQSMHAIISFMHQTSAGWMWQESTWKSQRIPLSTPMSAW